MDMTTKQNCKGLIYRGYNQVYNTQRGFEQRQGFRLAKRLSCKGCELCGGLRDYANETLTDYCIGLTQENINDGEYYELTCNDAEFFFIKYKKEKHK